MVGHVSVQNISFVSTKIISMVNCMDTLCVCLSVSVWCANWISSTKRRQTRKTKQSQKITTAKHTNKYWKRQIYSSKFRQFYKRHSKKCVFEWGRNTELDGYSSVNIWLLCLQLQSWWCQHDRTAIYDCCVCSYSLDDANTSEHEAQITALIPATVESLSPEDVFATAIVS